eukprot:1145151-Pelagomonas_calceolata.AAC.3
MKPGGWKGEMLARIAAILTEHFTQCSSEPFSPSTTAGHSCACNMLSMTKMKYLKYTMQNSMDSVYGAQHSAVMPREPASQIHAVIRGIFLLPVSELLASLGAEESSPRGWPRRRSSPYQLYTVHAPRLLQACQEHSQPLSASACLGVSACAWIGSACLAGCQEPAGCENCLGSAAEAACPVGFLAPPAGSACPAGCEEPAGRDDCLQAQLAAGSAAGASCPAGSPALPPAGCERPGGGAVALAVTRAPHDHAPPLLTYDPAPCPPPLLHPHCQPHLAVGWRTCWAPQPPPRPPPPPPHHHHHPGPAAAASCPALPAETVEEWS